MSATSPYLARNASTKPFTCWKRDVCIDTSLLLAEPDLSSDAQCGLCAWYQMFDFDDGDRTSVDVVTAPDVFFGNELPLTQLECFQPVHGAAPVETEEYDTYGSCSELASGLSTPNSKTFYELRVAR
jgi:hypothetical protein